MLHKICIAKPRSNGPVLASHRQTLQPRVGDGNRLQITALAFANRLAHCAEKRRAERQYTIAIASRSLAINHDWIAAGKPRRNFAIDRAGRVTPGAVDENRSLKFRQ